MQNSTYSAGTIAVSSGGTTVTGTSTSWSSFGVRPGDLLVAAGLMAVIDAVGSNSSITLKRAWPGSALSAANYDIILVDDETRALIAANTLLQSLSNGKLTSLAGLGAAADKLAYFTGANTFGLTDLTSAMRGLLATSLLSVSGNNLVTGSDVRLTGEAVTQSTSDTTSGRLLKTGAGVVQAYRAGNILGTVAQTGGVPTGAVIERGNNANGRYVRFADGMQICTFAQTTSAIAATAWTYPVAFTGVDTIAIAPTTSTLRLVNVTALGLTDCEYNYYDLSAVRQATGARLTVFGRWF